MLILFVCLFNLPEADVSADIETKEVALLKGKQRMRDQCFRRGMMRVKERERERGRGQFLPRLDEGRSWNRARLQEKHKDTGPLQYAAKLPFTSDAARLAFLSHTCVTACVTVCVYDSRRSPCTWKVVLVQPEMRPCLEKKS